MVLGTIFILTGIGWLTLAYPIEVVESYPSLKAQIQLMGLYYWAAVFIVVGVCAVLSGVSGYHTVGFTLLMALSSMWASLYFVSWAETGYWRAITQGSVLWLLIVILVWLISDWPDHDWDDR